MANYSADPDLQLYIRESGSLPPLYELHTEAARVIDSYLRNVKGISATQIADFGTTTLADLKAAACYWVLGMHFSGFVDSPGAAEAADRFMTMHKAAMSALYIEYSGGETLGASDVLSSGDCILG